PARLQLRPDRQDPIGQLDPDGDGRRARAAVRYAQGGAEPAVGRGLVGIGGDVAERRARAGEQQRAGKGGSDLSHRNLLDDPPPRDGPGIVPDGLGFPTPRGGARTGWSLRAGLGGLSASPTKRSAANAQVVAYAVAALGGVKADPARMQKAQIWL